MSTETKVSVTPVQSRADRRAFRLLPHRLYASDPHWVAPLNKDIRALLNPRRTHPFHASGDVAEFLARRDGEVVGRIAAIHNRDHLKHHNDGAGFFGFFECIEDQHLANTLLDAAMTWLKGRGLVEMRGPLNPSLNYESGCLVWGEPGIPYIMMPHNLPYYSTLFEGFGLTKTQDLLAYYMHKDVMDIKRWGAMANKLKDRAQATVRTIDMSKFRQEVETIVDIFNDAWSENWGFVPMNPLEIQAMAKELKPLVRPELCSFVVREGREVGFYLCLPNYNLIIKDFKGRLTPWGIYRLLASKRKLRHGRVLLMGVRKASRGLGIDAVLNGEIVRACTTHGIDDTESSWLLETNKPMINMLERVGSRHFRTYRVYSKSIETDQVPS